MSGDLRSPFLIERIYAVGRYAKLSIAARSGIRALHIQAVTQVRMVTGVAAWSALSPLDFSVPAVLYLSPCRSHQSRKHENCYA